MTITVDITGSELMQSDMEHAKVAVENWVESFVAGLNLCPFARRELVANRVRYRVVDSSTEEQLLLQLDTELLYLESHPDIETTLLIHPLVLQDFYKFNQFLNQVDQLLAERELEGIYQVASFHPDYQFAGTQMGDVENYTNRSPFPLLHLLREESLSRAIDSHPDPDAIPDRNIALLKRLGLERIRSMLTDL